MIIEQQGQIKDQKLKLQSTLLDRKAAMVSKGRK